ncbi:MAG: ABC transporter permease, partial [Thermovirgaceae bacterium]
MKYRMILERRYQVPLSLEILCPLLSIMMALGVSALFLLVLGVSPVKAFFAMAKGAFGSWWGLSEVVVKTIPLAICGIAVALSFRMKIWNIGAEGQIYLGALAAAAVVRYAYVESF